MKPPDKLHLDKVYKGLLLAALHLAIVLSLGAKLLHDRATCPRVWARAVVYDPDLPIRGRYLSLRLQVHAEKVYGGQPLGPKANWWQQSRPVTLAVENSQLVALPAKEWSHLPQLFVTRWRTRQGVVAVLEDPVAFFIPEDVLDPSNRPPGEELWVEVTIPKKGPPRPIRLGVQRSGVLTPLALR